MNKLLMITLYGIVIILFGSCKDQSNPVPNSIKFTDLNNSHFNYVVLDTDGMLVALGELHFFDSTPEFLNGQWHLNTWGEQSGWPPEGLSGNFNGLMWNDIALLNFRTASEEFSLSWKLDGFLGNKLVGEWVRNPTEENGRDSGAIEAFRFAENMPERIISRASRE